MTPPRELTGTSKVSVSIRFPEGIHDWLKEAAEERDLTMNYLVVHAVREFLERLPRWWDEASYAYAIVPEDRAALKAFQDGKSAVDRG